MTKPCRYCYTEVHRSAKICHNCHNAQTTLGITKSLLMTIFPILTTIASLGIAYYEKLEKDAAVVQLEREKLSATAAIELADDLSESLSDSQLAETYVSTYNRIPTKERLQEVEQIAKQQKEEKTLSKQELISLSKERKELRLMFKRSSSNKRKNYRKRKNQKSSGSVASGFRPGPASSAFRSTVVPAGGLVSQADPTASRLSVEPMNASPQGLRTLGNRSLVPAGSLDLSAQLGRRAAENEKEGVSLQVPTPIMINGKKVTPLLNVSGQMIKDVQKVR